ncbi:MAG: 4-demethylwyosine synthase TYW1 [Thermoplasmata archaeon]
MDPDRKRLLARQGYRVVGNHSAVKLCHWLREKLLRGRACYKEVFYGVESHRCLQMTPTVDQCNMNCLFCWRVQNFSKPTFERIDEPAAILSDCVRAQRNLITGFRGDPRCDSNRWREASEPRHVAISLTGEPTFYPRLGGLIQECHERGMSTFLVSNGTLPRVLSNLDPLPTQLYITVAAPTIDIYKKLCSPLSVKSWKHLLESLELVSDLDTRRVIRLTLVEGWNISHEDAYSELISRANPDFVEAKGYVFVGASRSRMRWENMPSHETIRNFSSKLSRLIGYPILDEKRGSRVVLLGSGSTDRRIASPVPF